MQVAVLLGVAALDAGVAAELLGSVAFVLPLTVAVALPPSAELAGEAGCPLAE